MWGEASIELRMLVMLVRDAVVVAVVVTERLALWLL